jgi:hypothetical protein
MRIGRQELPKINQLNFFPCLLLSRLLAISLCQQQHRFILVKINFIVTNVWVYFKQKMPKKQVFFTILQFMYGNLASLW